MEVLIGIDPHKATNAVAAVDEGGKLDELATFATNRAGLRLLEQWGKRFEKRRWAVEGAGGLGRPVAQHLVAAGERGWWGCPFEALRSRRAALRAGNERKNDTLDAAYTALAAFLRGERLAEVGLRRRSGQRTQNALRTTGGPRRRAH